MAKKKAVAVEPAVEQSVQALQVVIYKSRKDVQAVADLIKGEVLVIDETGAAFNVNGNMLRVNNDSEVAVNDAGEVFVTRVVLEVVEEEGEAKTEE